jgi:hypothetical protein
VGPQDVDDLEMLLGLGLPTLVRGHHEQHQPNRAHAGEHVPDEPLVPRDVDEADLAAGRQRGPGESQIDGQAAPLLLGPPVGVHPGQPDEERRFSVIDVARCGHNVERPFHYRSWDSA